LTIQPATVSDLDAVRTLFPEYANSLQVDLCFQGFEQELATLPGKYAPPQGRLLIAKQHGEAAGCVALRHYREDVCEMKRLFVRPAFRGLGLGRDLAVRIIAEAREAGYSEMVLDSLDRLHPALGLYQAMGFVETPPYYPNPLPGVVYRRLPLNDG
jgi:putative acetyltransferase